VAVLLLVLLLAVPLLTSPAQHILPSFAEGDDRPKLGTGG